MILLADTEGPDQCADAQADLGLRCSHMPEDAISHGAAFMIVMTSLGFQAIDWSCPT